MYVRRALYKDIIKELDILEQLVLFWLSIDGVQNRMGLKRVGNPILKGEQKWKETNWADMNG